MFSEETCYRSVTHIKSDLTVPDCCGLPVFCNKVLCLWNINPSKSSYFPRSLGDYGVIVCLYLWACVAVLSLVIVLFRSHMAALQHPAQSSISLLCLAVAVLHNVQLRSGVVWSGVVGGICSSPPAKSPHHMALFMYNLFHIPTI